MGRPRTPITATDPDASYARVVALDAHGHKLKSSPVVAVGG